LVAGTVLEPRSATEQEKYKTTRRSTKSRDCEKEGQLWKPKYCGTEKNVEKRIDIARRKGLSTFKDDARSKDNERAEDNGRTKDALSTKDHARSEDNEEIEGNQDPTML
jgi:hypothetical protein